MSSVGAVVNHESDDEYNPIRMLKKSMASTIQVHLRSRNNCSLKLFFKFARFFTSGNGSKILNILFSGSETDYVFGLQKSIG
jgi:hypothetical protein